MPIAFPPPSRESVIAKQLWLRIQSKAFDAVPAPNMGRPGIPFSSTMVGGTNGWSLNPGMPTRKHPNTHNPGAIYTDYTKTATPNPAGMIDELYDETAGFDRDMGQQNNRLRGVSLDGSGAPLSGCNIAVFTTKTNELAASTVSDGAGAWSVYPNQVGPYYVVEYKAGASDVFGTSLNTLVANPVTPGN